MIRLTVNVGGITPSALDFNEDMLTVGHSLSDESWEMVLDFMGDQGGTGTFVRQSIPGSPLNFNWENRFTPNPAASGTLLEAGGINGLVLTESVHFRHVQGEGYDRATDSFTGPYATRTICDPRAWVDYYNLASANGVESVFVYENWSDIRSGTAQSGGMEDQADPYIDRTWRERIDDFLPFWQEFVTMLRPGDPLRGVHAVQAGGATFTVTGSTPVYLIPGGQAMARVYDDMLANNLPVGVSFTDFFTDFYLDDIHPTDTGRYLIACVWYAVMFRQSPVGLSGSTVESETGNPFQTIAPADAAYLQTVAWDVVQNTPNTGL